MPMIEVPAYSQAFAANGGATGIVQVADSSGFYAGCEGSITHDVAATVRVIIVSITDATHVTCRIIADDNENQLAVQRYGGGSNLAAYTSVANAKLWMPSQLARVEINTTKPAKLNK